MTKEARERTLLLAIRHAILAAIDAIERQLGVKPRTSQLRPPRGPQSAK
jgi:hypothetical protein